MPQVVDSPGEHHNVVDVEPEGHDGGRVADALEYRTDATVDADAAQAQRLAERHLHEEHRYAAKYKRQRVRNEKGA